MKERDDFVTEKEQDSLDSGAALAEEGPRLFAAPRSPGPRPPVRRPSAARTHGRRCLSCRASPVCVSVPGAAFTAIECRADLVTQVK